LGGDDKEVHDVRVRIQELFYSNKPPTTNKNNNDDKNKNKNKNKTRTAVAAAWVQLLQE
jgi:hypothetical protein